MRKIIKAVMFGMLPDGLVFSQWRKASVEPVIHKHKEIYTVLLQYLHLDLEQEAVLLLKVNLLENH